MSRVMNWAELSWTDFQSRDMARCIAVLPIAAIEQHGPHLPVGVDTMIAEGHMAHLKQHIPSALDVLFLPTQAIGKSNEHLRFPGTLTLTAETAIRAWTEIGESVARAGCRKIIIVNSHGGNMSIMDIVARELRIRCTMLAVSAAWVRMGQPVGTTSEREATFGIHGGDYETSLMLAFRPELVNAEKIKDFISKGETYAKDFAKLRVTQPVGFGWMSQDLNENGVVGEAHLASAEKGHSIASHVTAEFIKLLKDVDDFELKNLRSGPLG
jgi:creatinine amidohydrolase